MLERKNILLFLPYLLFASAVVCAQSRVIGTSQLQAVETQGPHEGNVPTVGASALANDPMSTSITGARVALGPGDLIDISVFDTPELTQKVRVNSDGKVTLTLLGDVPVQGMTPDELQKFITRKLIAGHFVKKPEVSVFVAEYAGQMAYITGEVTRPGAYPLMRAHHLRDLISVAGGLTSRAGNIVTIGHTKDSAQPERLDLSNKDEQVSNPEIQPGDSITVAQAGIVYVLGDVERPGGFLMDRRTTLSVVQAIALAEGTKPSASLNKVRLIRTTEQSRQELPLNLRAILQSQSPDPELHAGDIIFVPGSLTRGMGRRMIDTVLATASGVAIYAYRP